MILKKALIGFGFMVFLVCVLFGVFKTEQLQAAAQLRKYYCESYYNTEVMTPWLSVNYACIGGSWCKSNPLEVVYGDCSKSCYVHEVYWGTADCQKVYYLSPI